MTQAHLSHLSSKRFSWGRALAHALVLPAVVIAFLLFKQGSARSVAFWKASGLVAAIWVATALPISYLNQTGQGDSIESLRGLLEAMRKGIAQPDRGVNYAGTPSAVAVAAGPTRSVTLSSTFAGGRHQVIRAYGLDVSDHPPFAVVIAIVTARPEQYTDLFESFRP